MKKVLSIISLAIIIISCSKDDNNKGKYRYERKFKDVFCRDYTLIIPLLQKKYIETHILDNVTS